MSVPFTVNGTNWRELDKLEEIRLGFSERNQAQGYSPLKWDGTFWGSGDGTSADTLQNNEPVGGYAMPSAIFFAVIHDEAVSFAAKPWVSSEPYDLNDPPDKLAFGSFHDFCEYCGGTLYTSPTDYGWRRAVDATDIDNPTFIRGYARGGDILGPWLIEDIVLAMENATAYDWTRLGPILGKVKTTDKDGYLETSTSSTYSTVFEISAKWDWPSGQGWTDGQRESVHFERTLENPHSQTIDNRRFYIVNNGTQGAMTLPPLTTPAGTLPSVGNMSSSNL
ncbi:unnamed protein product, partial [marine sediment metagenome]